MVNNMDKLNDIRVIIGTNNILVDSAISTMMILAIIFFIGYLIYKLREIITAMLVTIFGTAIGLFMANYITFVGTIHHELSHAIVAFITGAKVKEIRLLDFNNNTLGHVNYIPRGPMWLQQLQLSLTSIAPIITGIITNSLIISYLKSHTLSLTYRIIIYYVMFSIITHMSMSKQDIKIGLKGLPACIIVIYSISLLVLQ